MLETFLLLHCPCSWFCLFRSINNPSSPHRPIPPSDLHKYTKKATSLQLWTTLIVVYYLLSALSIVYTVLLSDWQEKVYVVRNESVCVFILYRLSLPRFTDLHKINNYLSIVTISMFRKRIFKVKELQDCRDFSQDSLKMKHLPSKIKFNKENFNGCTNERLTPATSK